MKIRTKLIIAFLAVILIPVMLGSGMMTLISAYQTTLLRNVYGIEDDSNLFASTSFRVLAKIASSMEEELDATMRRTPELLEDPEYLAELSNRFAGKNAWLVMEKKGDFFFIGNEDYSEKDVIAMTAVSASGDRYGYESKTGQLVRSKTILYADGTEGTSYIFAALDKALPEYQRALVTFALLTLLILVLTATFMVMWIYRSIVSPLNRLRVATREIRDGNLDFSVEYGSDEIGQLFCDFDEMRIRLKETSEEKLQYDQDSKELISNISHDLKTPITAIKGYVEGIMDGVADTPEKLDRYVRTIYNKANEMTRLIDELTYYSKIDSNRIPYTFIKLNVEDYFRDCADELSMELASENVAFTFENELKEPAVVIADPEQLKKVINNIVGNSVKYMDKPVGHIRLRITSEEDSIEVSIEDNGKGIAPKDLPYVFDRMYRADSSRNSATGGSGIGLSIVKKIIEDHAGRIWATSKEGVGTEMHFVLRKYVEQEKPAEVSSVEEADSAARKKWKPRRKS